jgi:hypothetical protein
MNMVTLPPTAHLKLQVIEPLDTFHKTCRSAYLEFGFICPDSNQTIVNASPMLHYITKRTHDECEITCLRYHR